MTYRQGASWSARFKQGAGEWSVSIVYVKCLHLNESHVNSSAMRSLRSPKETLTAYDRGVSRSEYSGAQFLDSLLAEGDEPLPGAHILSPRRGYLHHGIYVGDGRVVHYSGLAHCLFRGPVEEVSLARFADGRSVWTRWRRQPAFDRSEIIRRARSRVGEDRYQILHNNCEHFCEWCIQGESRSYQVELLLSSRRALALMLELIGRCQLLARGFSIRISAR